MNKEVSKWLTANMEMEVKFVFEVCVMDEKEIRTTFGGKNFSDFLDLFSPCRIMAQ